MAQDEEYQTTVYMEQDGDRFVAGSGGTFAIESGGSVAVYSGGQFTIENDGIFVLAGANLSGNAARRILVSEFGGAVTLIPSALSVKLTGRNNLPANARIVTIVGSTAMSKCSFWLTSVSAGREVWLRAVGDVSGGFTNNNTSIIVSTSGCILLGSVGNAISGFTLYTSANSNTGVYLKAVLDNTWAIIAVQGAVGE
jgi:hypothetical protein